MEMDLRQKAKELVSGRRFMPHALLSVQLTLTSFQIFQLLGLGREALQSHMSLYAFALLAPLLTLIGAPFFWLFRGFGWILFFLSHSASIFQQLTFMLANSELDQFSMAQSLAWVFVHTAFLRWLTIRPILDCYATRNFRIWSRASRTNIQLIGHFRYLGRQFQGVLTDISLTGCRIETTEEVQVGETVRFTPLHRPGLEYDVRLLRKEHKPAPSGFVYGARFVQALDATSLHGLLSLTGPSAQTSDSTAP